MIKQLKLFSNRGKFTDDIEFVNVENETLSIEIVTEFGSNVDLFAIIKNGNDEKQIKIENKLFVIEKNLLKVGECNIIIVARVGSKQVGRYTCVPIIITELDNKIIAIDEIENFKLQIKDFGGKIEDFEIELDRIKNLTKTLI